MKPKIVIALIISVCVFIYDGLSQGVAINYDDSDADPSAILDVKSNSSGILIPRLTISERNSITNPAAGLLVYQTNDTVGFYFNAGTASLPSWIRLYTSDDIQGDLGNLQTPTLNAVLLQGNSAGDNQITNLNCDGGLTDAASCGWINSENNLWTLSSNMCYSPDDIWTDGGTSFGELTEDDDIATADLPFAVRVNGTDYTQVSVSTNGFVELGSVTNSDFTNDCLPSSNHSNPFVAAYWDDLVPQGANVRYGVVGYAPNRTFIADYECRTFSTGYDVSFQLQLHETSNLINVKYRSPMNENATGQSATIGFQTGTDSNSTVYCISCNGKVLDDNRADSEGWSVCPVR